jgi:hypothetical protein
MSAQGDGFDRVHGTGIPDRQPLGPATKRIPAGDAREIVWTKVPGKPYLEQSNETPPRLRTTHYHNGR